MKYNKFLEDLELIDSDHKTFRLKLHQEMMPSKSMTMKKLKLLRKMLVKFFTH